MKNIFSIKEVKKGLSVKPDRDKQYCSHKELVLVDEHYRILECDKCGQKIDPFDYLIRIARDNDRLWNLKQEYQKEATEAAQRLEDLKRQEKNARLRIKRIMQSQIL